MKNCGFECRSRMKNITMPWEVRYIADKETLVVTTTGRLSEAAAKAMTNKTIALLRKTKAIRVLGDCRGMESGPPLGAVYWLVAGYKNRGVPKETRIAVVQPERPQAAEVTKFFRTVCCNRRYEAEVFDTPEAAEAWLDSSKPALAEADRSCQPA